MARAIRFPWGGLRPASGAFLDHPDGELVELDEAGRVIGPVKKAGPKKKRAARKKAAPASAIPAMDNSDLGDIDELDNF